MECWFFLYSKRIQILKTEYKYGQYCTPLSQSDCRYFFVLAIILFIKLILSHQTNSFNLNCIFLKEKIVLIGDYNVIVHYNYHHFFFFSTFRKVLEERNAKWKWMLLSRVETQNISRIILTILTFWYLKFDLNSSRLFASLAEEIHIVRI